MHLTPDGSHLGADGRPGANVRFRPKADMGKGMPDQQPSMADIAGAYIAAVRSGANYSHARFDPIECWLDCRWDDLWLLIQSVSALPEEIDSLTLATVAAGPLENLLSKAPASYADQVLTEAGRSPQLARMLTGVWPSSIVPETWERVVEFCRKVPDPIDGTYQY